MKDMNLARLLDSCCVAISDELQGALHDYLMDADVDLNTLNVDDLYVNSVQFLYHSEYNEDEYHMLLEDPNGVWVI